MRLTTRETLLLRAKQTFPYPPNPFCSANVSVQLVAEVLLEAGYEDFQLYVHPSGIHIEPKEKGE